MKFRERYKFEPTQDFIGKGGFSRVYKAFDVIRKRYVALKFYSGIESDKYDIISEINRMDDVVHPNLIRYYDATIIENLNAIGEKEQNQIGIMEYANAGDVGSFFKDRPDDATTHQIVLDILRGLNYLHKKGIIHRDMKPKNILLNREDDGRIVAKICDFGISKKVEGDDASVSSQLLGSVEYMAPEQFAPVVYGINDKASTNADLWSLGIILYELFTQKLPFGSRTKGITYEQILNNILFKDLEMDYSDIPDIYVTIIKKCLVKKASQRVASAQILIDILEGKIDEKHNNTTTIDKPIRPKTTTDHETSILSPKNDSNSSNNDKPIVAGGDHQKPMQEVPISDKTPIKPPIKPTVKRNILPSSPAVVETIQRGKNYFRVANYPESFRCLEPYQQYTAFDTEAKFFLGYMYYNGKVGGAHDPIIGRQLMNEAKEEDHALIIDLMVRYVLSVK